MKLTEGTSPDGTVAQIGQIVINWVSDRAVNFLHSTQCCRVQ